MHASPLVALGSMSECSDRLIMFVADRCELLEECANGYPDGSCDVNISSCSASSAPRCQRHNAASGCGLDQLCGSANTLNKEARVSRSGNQKHRSKAIENHLGTCFPVYGFAFAAGILLRCRIEIPVGQLPCDKNRRRQRDDCRWQTLSYAATARETPDGEETMYEMFRILDNFNLSVGASAEGSGESDPEGMRSSTIWTTVYDTENLVLQYHTMHNRRVRQIDFKKLDFDAKDIIRLQLDRKKSQDIDDITSTR